jgi:hypothetical protein
MQEKGNMAVETPSFCELFFVLFVSGCISGLGFVSFAG